MSDETAVCRGCGMELMGKPYYMGGLAYHPRTGEQCKINFYGGFVCSHWCDRRSSKELEDDMPGAGNSSHLSCSAEQSLRNNWPEDYQ